MLSGRMGAGAKAWINKKKDRRRLQGKEVKADSKFTGRKRTGGHRGF
jgi:hypothetical protein